MPGANAGSGPVLAEHAALAQHRQPGRFPDLGLRLVSALVLVPLALGCAWLGGPAWLVLIVLAALWLGFEWLGMLRQRPDTVLLATGFAYIALALASLVWLRSIPYMGRSDILFLLVVTWASDIGAYAAGRAIGGPRLAPAISPGKTLSGAVGGLVAAVFAGLALSIRWPHGHWTATAALALLIGLAAELGDLLESLVKRLCGVKDSGSLIPGHGGLLDRVDGLLLAAIVMALLGLWLGGGIVLWS